MPKPVPRERATKRDVEVARIINATRQYGLRIALEASNYDIWPSVLCAVLEQESGFRNVYGHDPVKRGQLVGGNVTRLNYARYKALRKLGFGMQGVGPGQLTWWEYQDEADRSRWVLAAGSEHRDDCVAAGCEASAGWFVAARVRALQRREGRDAGRVCVLEQGSATPAGLAPEALMTDTVYTEYTDRDENDEGSVLEALAALPLSTKLQAPVAAADARPEGS